jgi:regulator of protease activity HflC (stomatin/prohibitin superfamily)
MEKIEMKISPFKIGAGVVALLTALFLLFGSWYTVPEGYRGVILRNGAVVGEATPGLGFKLPLVDSVVDMSVQTEKIQFTDLAAYSRDIQQAKMQISVNLHLQADKVREMYSTAGTGYAEKIVWPAVYKRVKEVFGQFTAAEAISKRQELGTDITDAILKDIAARGLVIESIQVENIDFSDTYEQAAEAAATAQAKVKQAQQELEQIKVSSQQKVAQADADATATRTTADAQAYATKAAGLAEAAAIQAKGEALRDNPQLVSLITAQKWNGTLPTTMVPGSAVPFVSLARQP